MASKKTTKSNTKRKKTEKPEPTSAPKSITCAVWAVGFILLGIFTIVSLFNDEGSFIYFFSKMLKGLFGIGIYIFVPAFFLVAVILFKRQNEKDRAQAEGYLDINYLVSIRIFSCFMVPLLGAAIYHTLMVRSNDLYNKLQFTDKLDKLFSNGIELKSGGAIGGMLSIFLENAFGIISTNIILFVLFFIFAFISIYGDMRTGVNRIKKSVNAIAAHGSSVSEEDDEQVLVMPAKTRKAKAETVEYVSGTAKRNSAKQEKDHNQSVTVDIPLGDDFDIVPAELPTPKVRIKPVKRNEHSLPNSEETSSVLSESSHLDLIEKNEENDSPNLDVPVFENKHINKVSSKEDNGFGLAEITKTAADASENVASQSSNKKMERRDCKQILGNSDYIFPSLDLLQSNPNKSAYNSENIERNKARLGDVLRSFGINAAITNTTQGPTITRYDIRLEEGVKLAKVTNLAGDLALQLGAVNVRVAPIPGEPSTVGIEVPNKYTSTVFLREVIESSVFEEAKSKISFAIGKDIGGNCIVGNIAKLPHLLIAGTTGSGKSVCMNSLILSLLYKAKPDEVKLIMIDPKMVELGIYNGIPHLFAPVVTDPKKAAGALQWSVVEMLKRYRMFSETGVRELTAYNKWCERNDEEKLPQIVIVIDELADLMMAASKEVEESICRVAQMGRAAGIHLVIATQRPSADVITGLMKANIPSRIAFAVSSALESRIILDQPGAEKLIGMGDMLFNPVGLGKPLRIQGTFVSDEEREAVIDFIKQQGNAPADLPADLLDFMNKPDESEKSKKDDGEGPQGDFDALLPKAVAVAIEMKQVSVSNLQRRVKLGYSRAARIMDQMEELGVVGPYNGAKPREVIVDQAKWLEIANSNGIDIDE